jgi:hypothetical protein
MYIKFLSSYSHPLICIEQATVLRSHGCNEAVHMYISILKLDDSRSYKVAECDFCKLIANIGRNAMKLESISYYN